MSSVVPAKEATSTPISAIETFGDNPMDLSRLAAPLTNAPTFEESDPAAAHEEY